MREQFGDKITLKTGIEFGVQRETVEEFNQAFAAHPFDFVILSNHQADGKMYYNGEYGREKTKNSSMRAIMRLPWTYSTDTTTGLYLATSI